MATIKKIQGKNGISYKITVFLGRNQSGKQIRHYMTYTPKAGTKDSRAEKEALLAASRFEERLKQGYQVNSHLTFEEYSETFLASKLRAGLKRSTYDRYLLLLRRINPAIGFMKLQDIRPYHLNSFYDTLMSKNIRFQSAKGLPIKDLTTAIKEKKMSQDSLARICQIAPSTIRQARQGKAIQWDKAEAISQALGYPVQALFRKQQDQTPLSDKSVLEHHRLIRTILGQAEKELIVPYNAASKATPPRVHLKEVNTFQPEEITAILNALEKEPIKWRCLIHLLIVTGCRRGEICGLTWSQVDLDHGVIHICQSLLASDCGTYTDTPKTPESQRYIKIPPETVHLLQQYALAQERHKVCVGDRWEETGYVFTGEYGRPIHPDSVNGWLNQFSKRHGLRHINPHAFRHSMASILINSGTDILSVSHRLGHTKASTTLNFYGHMLQQAEARSSECIAQVLLRKKGDPV